MAALLNLFFIRCGHLAVVSPLRGCVQSPLTRKEIA
jgi:hypothetical protein